MFLFAGQVRYGPFYLRVENFSLYRQFCIDLYIFLHPEGTDRLRTTAKLCKHHPYKTALPCVQPLGGRSLQENDYDCGASNVESMALRDTLDFVQADMASLRSQLQLQFAMFCCPLSKVRPVRSHLSTLPSRLHTNSRNHPPNAPS